MELKIKGLETAYGYTLKSEQANAYIEPSKINGFIQGILPSLSKSQIEELSTSIRHHYMTRFKKRKNPKYGSINRGFTEPQLMVFLKAVDSTKLRLLYSYQAELGLRVGEAVMVNMNDINLETRELTVKTEKTRVMDTLKIPVPLFKQTLEFAQEHTQEIEEAKGYIFYTESKRKEAGHVEVNYVRNQFRRFVEEAGLDQVYDVSEEAEGRPIRKLHRLSTHSLRHFAITRFARQSNGNLLLTSRFARHSDLSTVNTYVALNNNDVYDIIDAIAVSEVAELKKRLVK